MISIIDLFNSMIDLSEDFWSNKYAKHKTGWDLGAVSPPLKAYFDQLEDLNLKILIPGAGNAYEAEYLVKKGFKNVFVVDISEAPLKNLKERVPEFPINNLIHKDFFELEMTFDVIIEQTFFCAIHPEKRAAYAEKMNELLNANGKLVGLLFDAELNTDHPPFGGNKTEYINYFKPYFNIDIMEPCYNSYHNRQGMELFVKLKK
ncbi:methyltransferase [Tenacibaculum amylolyticum]|uniref:methyltransferase n=1 Tax=Tenacibaculum amylolyticum TaxID=104269 RepID=UPI003893A728